MPNTNSDRFKGIFLKLRDSIFNLPPGFNFSFSHEKLKEDLASDLFENDNIVLTRNKIDEIIKCCRLIGNAYGSFHYLVLFPETKATPIVEHSKQILKYCQDLEDMLNKYLESSSKYTPEDFRRIQTDNNEYVLANTIPGLISKGHTVNPKSWDTSKWNGNKEFLQEKINEISLILILQKLSSNEKMTSLLGDLKEYLSFLQNFSLQWCMFNDKYESHPYTIAEMIPCTAMEVDGKLLSAKQVYENTTALLGEIKQLLPSLDDNLKEMINGLIDFSIKDKSKVKQISTPIPPKPATLLPQPVTLTKPATLLPQPVTLNPPASTISPIGSVTVNFTAAAKVTHDLIPGSDSGKLPSQSATFPSEPATLLSQKVTLKAPAGPKENSASTISPSLIKEIKSTNGMRFQEIFSKLKSIISVNFPTSSVFSFSFEELKKDLESVSFEDSNILLTLNKIHEIVQYFRLVANAYNYHSYTYNYTVDGVRAAQKAAAYCDTIHNYCTYLEDIIIKYLKSSNKYKVGDFLRIKQENCQYILANIIPGDVDNVYMTTPNSWDTSKWNGDKEFLGQKIDEISSMLQKLSSNEKMTSLLGDLKEYLSFLQNFSLKRSTFKGYSKHDIVFEEMMPFNAMEVDGKLLSAKQVYENTEALLGEIKQLLPSLDDDLKEMINGLIDFSIKDKSKVKERSIPIPPKPATLLPQPVTLNAPASLKEDSASPISPIGSAIVTSTTAAKVTPDVVGGDKKLPSLSLQSSSNHVDSRPKSSDSASSYTSSSSKGSHSEENYQTMLRWMQEPPRVASAALRGTLDGAPLDQQISSSSRRSSTSSDKNDENYQYMLDMMNDLTPIGTIQTTKKLPLGSLGTSGLAQAAQGPSGQGSSVLPGARSQSTQRSFATMLPQAKQETSGQRRSVLPGARSQSTQRSFATMLPQAKQETSGQRRSVLPGTRLPQVAQGTSGQRSSALPGAKLPQTPVSELAKIAAKKLSAQPSDSQPKLSNSIPQRSEKAYVSSVAQTPGARLRQTTQTVEPPKRPSNKRNN